MPNPIDWSWRPKSRIALFELVLLAQIAVLLAGELVVDFWLRTEMSLAPIWADRLLMLRLSIALGVLMLTGAVLFLASRRYKDAIEDANTELEDEVRRQVEQGLSKRNALIFGLAKLADYRDTDTGAHLERIGQYAAMIAERIRPNHNEITPAWINRLTLASSLHDIGKVGIPDRILLKPGRLTDDERTEMEKHTLIGADTLLAIRQKLGPDEFIDMGTEIALQHHEKWDGTGYPFGLSGGDISLAARIVAIADFYDAVTSERVYKQAMPHHEATNLIRSLRGTHFDPEIADAYLALERAFDSVRTRLHAISPVPTDQPFEAVARRFVREQGGYAEAA